MANDKITVKLLTRLAGIGKEGEIVEVSRSQAKNFMIPKGLAKEIDEKGIQAEKERIKKKQDQHRHLTIERHEIAKQLHAQELTFELTGQGDKIFGGIGEHEIIERIKKVYGVELEKRHISLPGDKHIKKAGSHDVKIHLGEDTYVRMTAIVSVKAG